MRAELQRIEIGTRNPLANEAGILPPRHVRVWNHRVLVDTLAAAAVKASG